MALLLRCLLLFGVVCLCLSTCTVGQVSIVRTEAALTDRPLVKPTITGRYRAILSVDGNGLRGAIAAEVLIEVESAIKRYVLNHASELPFGDEISSLDDFDVNLVDYFDCMTSSSSGSWSTMYLASRGGHGAARDVLTNPAIVAKYGRIPTGGAMGLRVFYQEFAFTIFPVQTIDLTAGTPFDVTNPSAPGVATPLYSGDSLEGALQLFLGNSTVADLDTSFLAAGLDILTSTTVFFVQNRFRTPSVASSARLISRATTRSPSLSFTPDLVFSEGKNYKLSDVGSGTAASPGLFPAKAISPVHSNFAEFVLIDGFVSIDSAVLPAAYFVAAQTNADNFDDIAILSIGTGRTTADLRSLASVGIGGWLDGYTLINLFTTSGVQAINSLVDYIYYSNPITAPYQYLRIQTEAAITTEEGAALTNGRDPTMVGLFQTIGLEVAESYSQSIGRFVQEFIFG